MTNTHSPDKNNSPADSWAQWFDRCAAHYQDPRMKMAYYEDGKTGKPVSSRLMEAIYEDIWNKLEAKQDSVILDVGGGVGLFSAAYNTRVGKVIATDIAPSMIQTALKLHPGGNFIVCDAASLPFGAYSVDRILCYSVFHYLKDLAQVKKVLDEFTRVVKPSGLILIGDILKVAHPLPEDKEETEKQSSQWWPSELNHNLTKFPIDQSFFTDYCQNKGISGSILRQEIPEKRTASERYDCLIRLSDDG